jgi:hypothetical protein
MAKSIRQAGSEVRDSREEFLGHADLDHGFPASHPDDPASTPEALKQMDDRISALLQMATYHHDPSPLTPGWSGSPLAVGTLAQSD